MIIQLTILAILIVAWYFQRVKRMTVLERSGIPGPKPHLIYGNINEYNKYGFNQCFEIWKQKYGTIFGYYLGGKPFVVVSDPELLKIIKVKEFQLFFHRPHIIPGGRHRYVKFYNQADRVDGYRWKHMRQAMSPWFSSAHLKTMIPIIKLCSDEMLYKLEPLAKSDEEFDILKIFQSVTMDTVNRCAFGVVSNDNNINDLFGETCPDPVMSPLLFTFPEFSFVINLIRDLYQKVSDIFQLNSFQTLWKSIEDIVDLQMSGLATEVNNNNKHKTIIDLMVKKSDKIKDKSMAKNEIIANTHLICEATFEGTVSILGFVVHHLVNYPVIQQRVYEEVERVINSESNGLIDYEVVNRLEFTEAVINEATRLYPNAAIFMSHSPDSDYKYGSLTLPKGVDIRVPLFQLHRDPEYWSDPNVFDPDRFLGDKQKLIDPFVFQPFGCGPRLCPGKRFVIFDMKLILAQILLKYRMIASDKTEPIDGIELNFTYDSLSPQNGIHIKLMPRVVKIKQNNL